MRTGETTASVMLDRWLGVELGVKSVPTFFLGTVEPDGLVTVAPPFFGSAPVDLLTELMADLGRDSGGWQWWE